MPWAKFDDKCITHPKILSLSLKAKWLWFSSIVYCCKHKTDGVITYNTLKLLNNAANTKIVIRELVKKGIMTTKIDLVVKKLQNCDEFVIRNFEKYQPTKRNKKTKEPWHEVCSPEPEPEPIYTIDHIHTSQISNLNEFIDFAAKLNIDKKSIPSHTYVNIAKLLPLSENEMVKFVEAYKRKQPKEPLSYFMGVIRGMRKKAMTLKNEF